MGFEQAGGPAARALAQIRTNTVSLGLWQIEELAREIDRTKLKADAIAEKIASPDRERSDFADYEKQAEKAQRLAGQQSNWETLIDMGFVK